MWDYFIVFCGFAVLIAIKIFLVIKTHNKNKNLYQSPEQLARDIFNNKKKDTQKFIEEMYDINKLKLLVVRSVFYIKAAWEKIKAGESKDCTLVIEKFRQIAILLNILLLQHEKDANKRVLSTKALEVEKTLNEHGKILQEIKAKMDKEKYFGKFECKTIANYYDDIYEIINKIK